MNANYFYNIAIIGFFGLFTLLMLWHTVLAPPQQLPVALNLLIVVPPLLIPMHGMLNRNHKSLIWMAYISLFYFIHGSIEAYVNAAERPFAILEVALSLLLFLGTTFYVRFAEK